MRPATTRAEFSDVASADEVTSWHALHAVFRPAMEARDSPRACRFDDACSARAGNPVDVRTAVGRTVQRLRGVCGCPPVARRRNLRVTGICRGGIKLPDGAAAQQQNRQQ